MAFGIFFICCRFHEYIPAFLQFFPQKHMNTARCILGAPRRMVSVFDFCLCCICRSPPNIKGISRTALARLIGISPPPGSLRAAPITCDGFITLKLWLDRSIIITCMGLGRVGAAALRIWHWFYRSVAFGVIVLAPYIYGEAGLDAPAGRLVIQGKYPVY